MTKSMTGVGRAAFRSSRTGSFALERRRSDGAVLPTLQGGTLTVDVRSGWCRSVRLIDNDPDARDATVVSPNVGGEATNGFAHGIDRVLRPINL